MELGKLISKAISCIDSYINPPTEKQLKDKHKTEFYVYISQFPGFMAMNILDEIEELEMDILSEDYYNIRAGKMWKEIYLTK